MILVWLFTCSFSFASPLMGDPSNTPHALALVKYVRSEMIPLGEVPVRPGGRESDPNLRGVFHEVEVSEVLSADDGVELQSGDHVWVQISPSFGYSLTRAVRSIVRVYHVEPTSKNVRETGLSLYAVELRMPLAVVSEMTNGPFAVDSCGTTGATVAGRIVRAVGENSLVLSRPIVDQSQEMASSTPVSQEPCSSFAPFAMVLDALRGSDRMDVAYEEEE